MDKGGQTHQFENYAHHNILVLNPGMNQCPWSDIERIGDEVLRDLETIKTPNLIVDLSELDYIGSAMVALVVRIWKKVKAKEGRLVVVNRNPLVLEVFKISKLDNVWTIVEYREDALYELGVSKEAETQRRNAAALLWAAALAALAALVGAGGLAMHLAKPGVLDYPLIQIVAFGGSAIGVLLGLLLLIKGEGGRRALGFFAAVLSLAVFVIAIFYVPLSAEAKPNPPINEKKKSGPAEKSAPVDKQAKTHRPAVAEKPPVRTEE